MPQARYFALGNLVKSIPKDTFLLASDTKEQFPSFPRPISWGISCGKQRKNILPQDLEAKPSSPTPPPPPRALEPCMLPEEKAAPTCLPEGCVREKIGER